MPDDSNKISINACLRASIEEIKKSISMLPNTQLIKNANVLKYNVIENVNGKTLPNAEITFGSDFILIEGKNVSAFGISKTMLLIKFLSILAYVRQYYDVNIFELYPNIIEALQSSIFFEKHLNSNIKIEHLTKQVDALNLSNMKLSEDAVRMYKISADNLELLASFKDFFIRISESLKINVNINDSKLAESLSSFGVSLELYKKLAKFSYTISDEK